MEKCIGFIEPTQTSKIEITVWIVSKYGVFLIRIFLYSDQKEIYQKAVFGHLRSRSLQKNLSFTIFEKFNNRHTLRNILPDCSRNLLKLLIKTSFHIQKSNDSVFSAFLCLYTFSMYFLNKSSWSNRKSTKPFSYKLTSFFLFSILC